MFTTTTTFIVYILAMLIIGIVAARMTSSLNDYVLGGRSLGRVVTRSEERLVGKESRL